jgi:polyisoprenoid-binding protein YceI
MKLLRSLLVLASVSLLSLSAFGQVESYKIDPAHSSINFGIRHFFTKVPGSFTKFSGTITVDRANLEKSSAEAAIQVSSVFTNDAKRDGHLQSGDFFAADKNPTITFKSSAWKKTGADSYDVTGDLTIHGVTKPVVLKVKSLGFGPGMQGAMLSGWEASAQIDRRDFGLGYGQGVVGNDVEISINVEAHLQK